MSKKRKKDKSTSKNIVALAMQEKIKIEKWLKSLNFTQRHYIEKYAEEYYKRTQDPINEALDCCITAALIQRFEELGYDDILEFQDFIFELIKDHIEIDKNLKMRGIDIMANKINLEPKVRERVEELVKAGKKQSESIKELAIEFPTLSKSSLTNVYKKMKQELKDREKLKEVIEVKTEEELDIKLPFSEEVKKEHVEAYEKIFNEPFEDSSREEEIKEFIKENNTERTLKVIKQEVIAEGKYGEYKRDLEGVKFGEWLFKSIAEINDFEKNEIDKLRSRIEEIEGISIEAREMFFI